MREKHHILRNDSHMRLLFKFDDSTNITQNYAKNPIAGNSLNALQYDSANTKFGRGAVETRGTYNSHEFQADSIVNLRCSWIMSMWFYSRSDIIDGPKSGIFEMYDSINDFIWVNFAADRVDLKVRKSGVYYVNTYDDNIPLSDFQQDVWQNIILAYSCNEQKLYFVANGSVILSRDLQVSEMPDVRFFQFGGVEHASSPEVAGSIDEIIFKQGLKIDINQLTQTQKKGSL
jgi:hypothetical protein